VARGDPTRLGAQCAQCPLAREGRPHNAVLIDTVPNPRALAIGESPGGDEARLGVAFKGQTGQQLDKELELAGLSRRDFVVVNVIACMPPQQGKTEALMGRALKCCRPAFESQIAPYASLPALVMGKWGGRGYAEVAGVKLPKGGINKGRGFIRDNPRTGAKWIWTWHPTYALFREPYAAGAFAVDLARFKRLLTRKLRPGPERLVTEPTLKDIRDVILDGRVSVDVETAPRHPDQRWTGKDPRRARLKVLGLGNRHWGLAFPVSDARYARHLQVAIELLEQTTIIGQNFIWFDRPIIARHWFGNDWDRVGRNVLDAMHMRKALVTVSPASLAYIASIYDDAIPWKELGLNPLDMAPDVEELDGEESDEDEDDPSTESAKRSIEDDDKGLVFTRNMEELTRYCAQDTVEAARGVHGMEQEEAWQEPRVRRLHEFRMGLATQAAEMYENGIWLDPEVRVGLAWDLYGLIETRRKKLMELVGIPAFKATPDHMRSLLFRKHATSLISRFNLPDPPARDKAMWTKTGLCAVNQGALLMLLANPATPPEAKTIIRAYWQVDAPRKALSTFVVSKLMDQALGDDGRLRPEIGAAQTDTMRTTTKKPNTSTWSKEKD
jgi:uracil-DNA glycosylase family 4